MRVLFLTQRLPYAPNRGDRLRAYHQLQWLREHASVELVSLVHDEEEASHAGDVRQFVDRVTVLRANAAANYLRAALALPTERPLTHTLLHAGGFTAALDDIVNTRRPDVIFSCGSGMAKFAMAPPLAEIPLILDFVDVDSRKWSDLAAASYPPLSWIYRRESRTLGAFESQAGAAAVAALVVNQREATVARQLAPAANVRVIANGIELERLRPADGPAAEERVVFCGVMNYAPNEQGIRWFISNVWPIVRERRPAATLAIVGADPPKSLRALCARDGRIELTGRVPDVRPWLWTSAVSIAPLHVARGVQNKALEAIAAGLPLVLTRAVAAGLPPEAAPAFTAADEPEEFASAVIKQLAATPASRRARAMSADLSRLTWPNTLAELLPLLHDAVERQRR